MLSTMFPTNYFILKTKGHGIALLVLSLSFLNLGSIEFVTTRSATTEKSLQVGKLNGTVKTIMVRKGDIVDCVDIYKQPAFDHPLLKNHTLQIPGPRPLGACDASKEVEILEKFSTIVKCPEGTVPIKRKQKDGAPHTSQFSTPRVSRSIFGPEIHEYAVVRLGTAKYYGSHSKINLWHPRVANEGELSLAQTWLASGSGSDTNAMKAGWLVRYNEAPSLFVYWTASGYNNACYNHDCPGFVQTHRSYYPGMVLESISTYQGLQHYMEISIIQDRTSKAWKLFFFGVEIGYWPSAIIPKCADGVEEVYFGGEIINNEIGGHHTSTEMGSGHFSFEGYTKASSFRRLGYYDENRNRIQPKQVSAMVSNVRCYDVDIVDMTIIYYGGPGYDKLACL